ncbi:hypothetical protein QQF64_029621 [Cirrhinus molitorella]|uniref:Uncharacterized protein n=1 Tax=Cirrhinus molitorella TaxID=172907 RepID=A0ABR3N110_9TELE
MEGQTDPELTDCLRAAHGCAGLGKKERGRLRDLGSDGKKQGSRGHRVSGRKIKKKEKGKTQHYRASKEWEKSGVGYVVGSRKQYTEIVGVSRTIKMYLKFDQQKSSRLILH